MIHIIFIILQFILKIKRKLTLTSEKDIFFEITARKYRGYFGSSSYQQGR